MALGLKINLPRTNPNMYIFIFNYLDRIAGGNATLYLRGLALSYRPPKGLAAARIDALAFRVACKIGGQD